MKRLYIFTNNTDKGREQMKLIATVAIIAASSGCMVEHIEQQTSALATTVFAENFDGSLSGWSQSMCVTRKPSQQCLDLGQVTESQAGAPVSDPYFSFSNIHDSGGGCGGSIEIRHAKDFSVSQSGMYQISAYIGTKLCSGCNMRSRLLLDGALVFERIGPDLNQGPGSATDTLEEDLVYLDPGSHTVEIGMYSNRACNGVFGAYFDDIAIASLDEDDDGVPDTNDICPGTVATDVDAGVPSQHLGVNRWADLDGDGTFDTVSPSGHGPDLSFTMSDTAGCNCAQIIDEFELGQGHTKFGCSIGAMRDWVAIANP